MATLYYRPYTGELEQDTSNVDDNKTEFSDVESQLPEFQYIFHQDDEPDEDNFKTYQRPHTPDKYRLAMRRMSSEIVHLRDYIKSLNTHNHNQPHTTHDTYNQHQPINNSSNGGGVCHICAGANQRSQILVGELVDVDTISKEEILNKYKSLKERYLGIHSELQNSKEKIHKLQRELIKKNEKEAEYLKITKAHSSQNAILHDMQKKVAKIKNLEQTIKDQESIISKMEKHIDRQNKSKVKSRKLSPIEEINSSRKAPITNEDEIRKLKLENDKLRHELEAFKNIQSYMPSSSTMTDGERLELYQLLDKAENRILSLEKQIYINKKGKSTANKTMDQDNFGLSKIQF